MATQTFPRGGIHPHDRKNLTNSESIQTMPLPQRLVVPMIQNIGAPPKPIVKIGDRVLKGQTIAEPGGFVSVAAHAPTSGTVMAIGNFPHPFGDDLPAIVIDVDGEDEWVEGRPKKHGSVHLAPDDIRDMIQAAGIVGLGGAAFPTHVKLSPPKHMRVDTFILNGAECEPYITADHRLMLEESDKIVRGVKILMRVLDVSQGYIGIEENKPDAIAEMRKKCEILSNVKVIELKMKYPQGGEKQLINAITGREVPSGGLPSAVGCVVQNVGTVVAVADAIHREVPLLERVATITGNAINEPKNVRFRVGTLFCDIFDFCGGIRDDVGKVIMGGPMMGLAQFRFDVPAMKGTSGILCVTEEMIDKSPTTPCIKCARCVDTCPVGLEPTTIARFAKFKRYDDAQNYNALDCIECGCCAYICPSNIPLVQLIRNAKAKITAKLRGKK